MNWITEIINFFDMWIIPLFVIGIFCLLIFYFDKKNDKKCNDTISTLPDEQIEKLKDNEVIVKNDNQKKFSWYQKALITNIKENNSYYVIVVIWYNTVMQNHSTYNNFQQVDIKVKKDDFDEKSLKKGEFIKIMIEPYKSNINIV